MFKKILASALAVAMLAGMSVTAFADYGYATEDDLLLDEGELFFTLGDFGSVWYMLDEDDNITTDKYGVPQLADMRGLNPGDKIATKITKFELYNGLELAKIPLSDLQKPWFYFANSVTPTKDDVKGWKVDADWQFDEAEDLIEEIKIEALYGIDSGAAIPWGLVEITDTLNYYATIEFKDDVAEIDYNDLVGKLTLYERTKSNAYEPLQVLQMNGDQFATVGYESIAYDDPGFHDITSTGAPVRDFTDANMNEITELYFDGVGIFYTANIGDEGAKYLGFNMNPDHDLLAQYPTADMEFINFPGMVKFNRFGTFELFKQENQFAYAVVDGEIVTLESIARNGRVVDGIDEGYSLVLSIKDFPESFILSDTELELTEAEDEEVVEAVDAEPAA